MKPPSERYLAGKQRPDGVFCFTDPVAPGLRAILEAGLRVPQNVALVGVGNIHYSDQLRVPLGSMDQSSARSGAKCCGTATTSH